MICVALQIYRLKAFLKGTLVQDYVVPQKPIKKMKTSINTLKQAQDLVLDTGCLSMQTLRQWLQSPLFFKPERTDQLLERNNPILRSFPSCLSYTLQLSVMDFQNPQQGQEVLHKLLCYALWVLQGTSAHSLLTASNLTHILRIAQISLFSSICVRDCE